jgi:uncharacterized DUF497 family protein
MATLDRLEGFQWDSGNERKSVERHDVSQAEAEQVFLNGPLVVTDDAHSQSELRLHALGSTNAGRLLHLTFTLRAGGTLVRVISARPMSRKERRIHERAT